MELRTTLAIILLFAGTYSFAQNDYIIEINDTTFDISTDESYTILLDGKEVNFKFSQKDTLAYNDDLYSFKYSRDYKVSRMEIEEGIEQVMLITAEGSGILIQKYSTVNPSMMNEILLAEVTKESVSYGYEMTRKDYSRKLISGQKIEVDKAILTYKGEKNIYEVASIGKKDEGIMIMTMIMDDSMSEQGKKIIDLMWNSLTYK